MKTKRRNGTAADQQPKPKYVLITNITGVTVAPGVHGEASALLIQPPNNDIPFGHTGTRLRGFGTAGSLPTFTIYLDGKDTGFELRDASNPSIVMLTHDDKIKPLFSGAILKICGREFSVGVSDPDRPMAIDAFEDVTEVWKKLPLRVCEFWTFPAMPSVRFLPVDHATAVATMAAANGGL